VLFSVRTIRNTKSLCVCGGGDVVSLNATKSGTYYYHLAFHGKCCDITYTSSPFKKGTLQGSAVRCGQCTVMDSTVMIGWD